MEDEKEPTKSMSTDVDIESTLRDVIAMYHDLNPSFVEELSAEPSPLAFMRFVANNRPFVVRGGAAHWNATRAWTAEYLETKLGDAPVQVAVTPNGWADAPTRHPDEQGAVYFAKPLERKMAFRTFLQYIRRHRHVEQTHEEEEVWYAQTQNDNLRGEYADIFADVAPEIHWASHALGYGPDAINMWIGTARSTTALHRDPYQNIFCQVVGAKRFVLIPPIEAACVNEQFLPPATWIRSNGEGRLSLQPDGPGEEHVPCAAWNPDHPEYNKTALSSICRPLRVTLEPGDVMYLPAMWYHQVAQIEGPQSFCCSVNYWYDMEYGGSFFPMDQLVRLQSRALMRIPDQRDRHND